MRAAIALPAALVLASCGQGAAEVDPSPPESEEPEPFAQPMTPGLYAVGDGSQVYAQTRLGEDGTYTDYSSDGAVVGTGEWSIEDEAICFEPDANGEAGNKRCWLNDPPDPDGSFVTRLVGSDESYRVTPLDE